MKTAVVDTVVHQTKHQLLDERQWVSIDCCFALAVPSISAPQARWAAGCTAQALLSCAAAGCGWARR